MARRMFAQVKCRGRGWRLARGCAGVLLCICSLFHRAHCLAACARFLLGGALARGFGWGLCRGEDLGDGFQGGFGFVRPEDFQSGIGGFDGSDFQHGATESPLTGDSVEVGGSSKLQESSPLRSVGLTAYPKLNQATDRHSFWAVHEFGQSLHPWRVPQGFRESNHVVPHQRALCSSRIRSLSSCSRRKTIRPPTLTREIWRFRTYWRRLRGLNPQ
jgi:hypothetical protein